MENIVATLMLADWAVLLAVFSLLASLVLTLVSLCRNTEGRK